MRVRILAAAAIAGLWGMGSAMAQPIVIGVSTPQTGVAAVASEWEMWGVNLAVEEINAAGGLLGGRKLELMVLDNKCNPSEAVNVANKLVEAKVVAIEGAHCSSAHLASMKIVADAKIPMITGIASNPQITALAGPGRNEYSFRISPSDSRHDGGAGHLSRQQEAVQDGGDRRRGHRLRPRRRRRLQGGGRQGGRHRGVDRLPSAERAGLHQHPDAPAAAPARCHRHLPGRRRFRSTSCARPCSSA